MEVLTLERPLTELDNFRFVNLVRRDRHGNECTTQPLAMEHILDAAALVPSRRMHPPAPPGDERGAQILAVLIQPEASGDYAM